MAKLIKSKKINIDLISEIIGLTIDEIKKTLISHFLNFYINSFIIIVKIFLKILK